MPHDADPTGPGSPDASSGTADASPADAGVADAAGPPAGTVWARRALVPPLLDGLDLEWGDVDWVVFDIGGSSQMLSYETDYAPSATVRLGAMHDAGAVYFFVAVSDDAVTVDSTSVWEDDGVSLYLDGLGDGAGSYGADDHEIIVRADATWGDYPTQTSNIQLGGEVLPTPDGYVMELRVSKASIVDGVGAELGFDIGITDDDGHGDSNADGYGLWHVRPGTHCPDCCQQVATSYAWCDTSLLGRLVLLP